jgi:hypothetical protein
VAAYRYYTVAYLDMKRETCERGCIPVLARELYAMEMSECEANTGLTYALQAWQCRPMVASPVSACVGADTPCQGRCRRRHHHRRRHRRRRHCRPLEAG